MWKKYVGLVIFWMVILFVITRVSTAFYPAPFELGVTDKKLAECPSSPNCISSQLRRSQSSFIPPLRLPRDVEGPMMRLSAMIDEMPRSKLISFNDDYVYYQFRSFLFGFVDDIEFLRDVPSGKIHVRSSARFGYSDFGVNRKRVKTIRKQWDKLSRELRGKK